MRFRRALVLAILLACSPEAAQAPEHAPATSPVPHVVAPQAEAPADDNVPSLSLEETMTPYVLFPGPPEDRVKWNFFYRDGTPEVARELLEKFFRRALPSLSAGFESRDPDQREHAASTLFNGLVFFVRAAERRRELVRVYEDYAREASSDEMRFLSKVLLHVGDAGTLALVRELARKHGVDASDLALAPLPGLEKTLRAPISHMAHLDHRWASFFADGDTARITEIIALFGVEDRLRQHLEPLLRPQTGFFARLSGKARSPQRLMEALRPLGFRFDPATHAIVNPEDLDIFVMTDLAELSGSRLKVVVEALPEKLSGELVLHIAMKASAVWSLANNAAEHDAVLAVCEAEAQRLAGAAHLALLTVLAAAHEQRGEFASARAALQELVERSPSRNDLRRRSEALAVDEQFAAQARQEADAAAVELPPEEAAALARRAGARLSRTTAYHARAEFTLRGEPTTDEQWTRSQWQGRFAPGGRSHVLRAFWTRKESGLADEWLDIGAQRYMRGPGVWLKMSPSFPRVGESTALAYDAFARLLASRAPARALSAPAASHVELVYDAVDTDSPWTQLGAPGGAARVGLRVDRESGWLAGARVEAGSGRAPGFVADYRFVAPAEPFSIDVPDAIDMTDAKPTR